MVPKACRLMPCLAPEEVVVAAAWRDLSRARSIREVAAAGESLVIGSLFAPLAKSRR